MQLPKIPEDPNALITQLQQIIQARYLPVPTNYNYLPLQLALIQQSNTDSLFLQLIRLEHLYESVKSHSYCYYTVKAILAGADETSRINALNSQIKQMQLKQSHYYKITHLAKMRSAMIKKYTPKEGQKNHPTKENIDDLRFLSIQLIRAILQWKKHLKGLGLTQSPIFVQSQNNIMTKMIYDNQVILVLPHEKIIYHSAPNPLFVMKSQAHSEKQVLQINQCFEALANQKAIELQLTIDNPSFKGNLAELYEVQERSKIEQEKLTKLKTIYKTSLKQPSYVKQSNIKNYQSIEKVMNSNRQKQERISQQHESNIKNLEQLIQKKQISMLRDITKKGKFYSSIPKNQNKNKNVTTNVNSAFQQKLSNLKNEVQKNLAMQKQKKKQLPKVESEIKAAKPKIKILSQREVAVQKITTNILDMILSKPQTDILSRSKSTFYKQSKPEGSQMAVSKNNFSLKKNKSLSILQHTFTNKLNKSGSKERLELSKNTQMKQVDESLKILNNKLKQQSILDIYGRKYNKTISSSFSLQSIKGLNKNVDTKQSPKKQRIQTHKPVIQKDNMSVSEKIKFKEQRIKFLQEKLKTLKNSENPPTKEDIVQRQDIFINKKQLLQLQNNKLKEEMQMQELKYMQLKQKQYKLKEIEMSNKFKNEFQKIKQELIKKNEEYQLKIMEQKKRNKQNELKLLQIQQKSQQIKMQMQQKTLKQQLTQQLMQEQQRKKKLRQKQHQVDKLSDKMLEQIAKEQERYKQQIQRKAIEAYQSQKLRLNQVYMSLQKKNQKIAQQNRKRQQQLKKLEEQKLKEQQAMKQLQKQIYQKEKDMQYANFVEENRKNIEPVLFVQEEEDIEELKQRIKLEILEQMKKKRQLQEQLEEQFNQQRERRVQEIEEEIKNALKLEDEQLAKIQRQYQLKNQELIQRFNQERQMEQQLKKQKNEQSQNKLRELQRYHEEESQIYKHNTQKKDIQQIKHNKEEIISNLPKDKDNQQKASIKQLNQQQKQISDLVQRKQEQVKQKQTNQIKVSQQLTIQHTNTQLKSEIQQKQNFQSQKQLQNNQKPKELQSIRQNSQQIKQKYLNLLKLVTKPLPYITLNSKDIENYLTKYYSQLPHEVFEMMPFQKADMLKFFQSQKIDIFSDKCFGWPRLAQKKYLLFGSIDCIPSIASKYGQLQIEQIYIFSKNNPYQKTYLSKQIKIFQKIGYIYQKKTGEDNKHSIKFIVKVPKSDKKPLSDNFEIKATLKLQSFHKQNANLLKQNCLFYILSQGLKETLNQTSKLQLSESLDHNIKLLSKKMNDSPVNNQNINTELIHHNIVQVTIKLNLNYMRTPDQAYFLFNASQYTSNNQQKIFVISLPNNLSLLVCSHKEDQLPINFSLESFIETKLRKLQKIKQILLYLPIWEHNSVSHSSSVGPSPFSYSQQVVANLTLGSIVDNSAQKSDFTLVQAPFLFLIFQNSVNSLTLKRMLYGYTVKQSEIIKGKNWA